MAHRNILVSPSRTYVLFVLDNLNPTGDDRRYTITLPKSYENNEIEATSYFFKVFILPAEVTNCLTYEIYEAIYLPNRILERRKQMVGTPRVPESEPITTSPSRMYVVVTHDVVCPNEARAEKIHLPESFVNDSKQARYYYYSQQQDRGTRIFQCMAFEDYITTVPHTIDMELEEPLKFDTRSTSLADDMKQVRQMLDAWNDEQEHPSTCYCMIMRSMLHKMAFQDKFISDLKKELLNL